VPAASSWPWSFRDQGIVGRPLAPPIVARETVFVVSERRGWVAIGARPEDKDKAQKADKGKEGAGK
jgi:hypothetical protein